MFVRSAAACGFVFLAACGAGPREPTTAYSENGKPLTVIEFEDDTSWPFELASVRIALDGEVVVDHAAPVGDATKWAFTVPFEALPHGDHTISIAVTTRYASTRVDASEGCLVEWRSSRTFDVGARPVGVRIVVDSHDVTSRFIDRVDVDVAVAGARPDREVNNSPVRKLVAENDVCRDDAPLPFTDADLAPSRFGPDLLR